MFEEYFDPFGGGAGLVTRNFASFLWVRMTVFGRVRSLLLKYKIVKVEFCSSRLHVVLYLKTTGVTKVD